MTPNVILGIDPGPRDWSWALYDTASKELAVGAYDIVSMAMPAICNPFDRPLHIDLVAIEDIRPFGRPVGNSVFETCKTIGFLRAYFEYKGLPVILIPRKKIAAAITGTARSGDRQINAAMKGFVPALDVKRKGLNGHHRAAAAVAYVALGVYAEQRLKEGVVNG